MSSRTKKILLLSKSDLVNSENTGGQSSLPESSQEALEMTDDLTDSNSNCDADDDSFADEDFLPSDIEEEMVSFSDNSEYDENEDFDVQDDDIDNMSLNGSAALQTDNWHAIEDDEENNINQFQETAIMNFNINEIKSAKDAYMLFLSNDIIELIVEETNRYARQLLLNQNVLKSRLNSWTDCNEDEIKRFFSIILVMGLNELPSINLYWSRDPMFHNDFIANTMSRDRFLLLLRCIHFCNNETVDKKDRLCKIRNLLDITNKNFQTVLTPGRILVIDESMVPFQGRLLFKQYIPNKTHPYGIKLYKLCTVDGYTSNLIVYSGKTEKKSEMAHSEQIVHDLLNYLIPKDGHYLYADNFYSSLTLAEALYKKNIIYCGTLRSNRKGVPKSLPAKMKKGDICGLQKGCLRVIKWMDKRPVMMLSTDATHTAECVATGKRTRQGDDVLKPKVITDYNRAKKGVDFSDQMSSYHTVLRRSLKWYRKLAFEILFGISIVNAWIIFNKISPSKLSITEFRRVLARELIACPARQEETTTPKRVLHTFMKPTGSGKKRRRQCQGCYNELRKSHSSKEASKLVTKVISYCNDCPGQPGMCLSCFNKRHKK